jgi:hypothetical protein
MSLRNRQAECLARDLLREQGYDVIRSAGAHAPVDLVAWKGDGSLLFIRIARTRRATLEDTGGVGVKFRHDIDSLRRLPRLPYLTVQLWVYVDCRGWRFFDVYPGGVVEVEG